MCGSMVDIQSATADIRRGKNRTSMWADAQRDGRPADIGGAVCESSVFPFLVPRRKVWLTLTAGAPCSNAANIEERKTWTYSEFCTG